MGVIILLNYSDGRYGDEILFYCKMEFYFNEIYLNMLYGVFLYLMDIYDEI